MLAAGLLLTLSIFFQSSIESGWNGIRPIKNTKADLDKAFGEPKEDGKSFYRYSTEHYSILASFAVGSCIDTASHGRGNYSVASGTLLYLQVRPTRDKPLKEIQFDKIRYHEDKTGNVQMARLYANQKDGITIGTELRDKEEFLTSISYFVPAAAGKELSCWK